MLPPFFSLGFHYSKWEEEASAARTRFYNEQFEEARIPVDVLWHDLPYSEERQYFTFNLNTFKPEQVQKMSLDTSMADRRLVVITDPHIKKADTFHVYANGMQIENAPKEEGNGNITSSIFVKTPDRQNVFIGYCWPGDSVWVDFLNAKGQEYWSEQYSYHNFIGWNKLFHIWIDMNEPSVFGGPEGTMSKENYHI